MPVLRSVRLAQLRAIAKRMLSDIGDKVGNVPFLDRFDLGCILEACDPWDEDIASSIEWVFGSRSEAVVELCNMTVEDVNV